MTFPSVEVVSCYLEMLRNDVLDSDTPDLELRLLAGLLGRSQLRH